MEKNHHTKWLGVRACTSNEHLICDGLGMNQ
jgi:hypothetical protein